MSNVKCQWEVLLLSPKMIKTFLAASLINSWSLLSSDVTNSTPLAALNAFFPCSAMKSTITFPWKFYSPFRLEMIHTIPSALKIASALVENWMMFIMGGTNPAIIAAFWIFSLSFTNSKVNAVKNDRKASFLVDNELAITGITFSFLNSSWFFAVEVSVINRWIK